MKKKRDKETAFGSNIRQIRHRMKNNKGQMLKKKKIPQAGESSSEDQNVYKMSVNNCRIEKYITSAHHHTRLRSEQWRHSGRRIDDLVGTPGETEGGRE